MNRPGSRGLRGRQVFSGRRTGPEVSERCLLTSSVRYDTFHFMDASALIVCPVFNEQDTLRRFHARLRRAFRGPAAFIEDGSSDASGKILTELKSSKDIVLYHPVRRGYGAAIKTGFAFALREGFQKVVTVDADLQHDPADIPVFLRGLDHSHVVLGSRYLKDSELAGVPRNRRAINRYIASVIRESFGLVVSDPFCGMRGYRRDVLRKMRLAEDSYGIGLEIILEVLRRAIPFREEPIETVYHAQERTFLDGLDDPRKRLKYYLDVIQKKGPGVHEKKEILVCQSSSR